MRVFVAESPLQLLTGNNTRSTPSIDWYTTVFDAKTQRLFIFVRAGTGLGTQGYVSTDLGERAASHHN